MPPYWPCGPRAGPVPRTPPGIGRAVVPRGEFAGGRCGRGSGGVVHDAVVGPAGAGGAGAGAVAGEHHSLSLGPERELARDCEAAYNTVRRAAVLLREPGLIVTVHGRGTYVA